MSKWFVAGVCLFSCFGHATAAYAETCDAEQVLERLEREAVGTLSASERESARGILMEYCGQVRAETEVETREVVEAERKADETFEVFGMEIRKAEPDSKGNERLRTKR